MNSPLTVLRPASAEGVAWIRQSWQFFRQAVVPWMGMTAAALLVMMALAGLPHVGNRLAELLSPFLVVAYMAASNAARRGDVVTFVYLGTGFRKGTQALFVVGVFYMLGSLLIELLVQKFGGTGLRELAELAAQPKALPPEEAKALLDQVLPSLLLGLVLLTPILMATWFAPALILFNDFSPMNALWWSLWACAVNWRPVAGYSLLLGAIGLVALVFPFGLGLLVFLPLAMISTYCAYRAIFVPVGES